MSLQDENTSVTYEEYLSWEDKNRWEVMEGRPYMLSAPSWEHQAISGELYRQFANFLMGKHCTVFAAPFDLRLPKSGVRDEKSTDVFQPDLVVVCDREGLKKTGYHGVPSLVIEITSPNTAKFDKVYKFNQYEKAGVKEYWIVEPENKLVDVFALQADQRYGRAEIYSEEQKIRVSVFPELEIDLSLVFAGIGADEAQEEHEND